MAKLVSFNSLNELLEIMSSQGARVTIPVLGARGRADESQMLSKTLIALTWGSLYNPNNCLIEGYTKYTNGSIRPFGDELTSSNFSTYFPSGGMLVI